MRDPVEMCPPDAPILDPFAGSGTTLVAAAIDGRRCVSIEREERNCEIAAKLPQQTRGMDLTRARIAETIRAAGRSA